MIDTEVFPVIRMKIDSLLKITNEYQFYNLVMAIYCINLCINNKSVLGCSEYMGYKVMP